MESNYYPESSVDVNSSMGGFDTSVEVGEYPSHMTTDYNSSVPMALGAGFFFFMFLFIVAIYVYYAVSFQKMARKVSVPDDWFAWIPVLNIVLLLRIANRPVWWLLLMFVPILNIVIQVMVWMDVAKAMRKPEWWGILIIVPFVNLVVPGYLAFSDGDVVFEGPGGEDLSSGDQQSGSGYVQADSSNTDFKESLKMENPASSQFASKMPGSDEDKDLPKV